MNAVTNKPHFADIARNLIEGIISGRFPVGSLLPTELELCAQYATSRHTIRAALHELQQLGLVSRRKNVGTRVESAEPTNEDEAFGVTTRSRKLAAARAITAHTVMPTAPRLQASWPAPTATTLPDAFP
jgi:DNA-binding GntR family transcriptional regulator